MPVSRTYGYLKQQPYQKWEIILLVLSIAAIFFAWSTEVENKSIYPITYQTKWASPEAKVLNLINTYASNPNLVISIATCESSLGRYRTNFQNSGAIGLLQFKPSTWRAYCQGDINNDTDQILCFNKLYPSHKSWWECK